MCIRDSGSHATPTPYPAPTLSAPRCNAAAHLAGASPLQRPRSSRQAPEANVSPPRCPPPPPLGLASPHPRHPFRTPPPS
eukprot:13219-Prorocentrum_lima.AAC.1